MDAMQTVVHNDLRRISEILSALTARFDSVDRRLEKMEHRNDGQDVQLGNLANTKAKVAGIVTALTSAGGAVGATLYGIIERLKL
jgi:hypothetical protein